MNFWGHLGELRRRLLICIYCLIAGAGAGAFAVNPVIEWLARPIGKLVFLEPTEAFTAQIKIAVGVSFLICLPVILYQAWAFVATALATAGNMFAVRIHGKGLALFPTTAWGMLYGAGVAAVFALVHGVRWTFDPTLPYVLSLLYLAVLGSIVAFGAYLTLLKLVGAGPASYVGVSTPVIAMLLSTFFEGYRWTWPAALGVVLAICGNVLALRKPATRM